MTERGEKKNMIAVCLAIKIRDIFFVFKQLSSCSIKLTLFAHFIFVSQFGRFLTEDESKIGKR